MIVIYFFARTLHAYCINNGEDKREQCPEKYQIDKASFAVTKPESMDSTPSQSKSQSYPNRIFFMTQTNIIVKLKFAYFAHFFCKMPVVFDFCQINLAVFSYPN